MVGSMPTAPGVGPEELLKHDVDKKTLDEQPSSDSGIAPFVIVSSSYLLYTVTDGAIRMIVLLHAYSKGFTAMEVAIMFTLYEVAGVVTNLLAGIAGSRWGIRSTLLVGLCLQLVGISSLYAWDPNWKPASAIAFVTFSQMLCGIAKDLTKLGGKTVAKLVTPDEKQSYLFRLVSFITGTCTSGY
jgi:MFS family permease